MTTSTASEWLCEYQEVVVITAGFRRSRCYARHLDRPLFALLHDQRGRAVARSGAITVQPRGESEFLRLTVSECPLLRQAPVRHSCMNRSVFNERAWIRIQKGMRAESQPANDRRPDGAEPFGLLRCTSSARNAALRRLYRRPTCVRRDATCGHSTYCDETAVDYYDFLVLDKALGCLLVSLGRDGHGVAARCHGRVRSVLRDRATRPATSPDLMSRLTGSSRPITRRPVHD